jgi:hypothetical protein
MRSSHRSVFHWCSTLHASAAVNCDTRRMKVAYGGATEGEWFTRRWPAALRDYCGGPGLALTSKALSGVSQPAIWGDAPAECEGGEGSQEVLGGTLAPDSNPKDGHFRRHRQRCPNAPDRRRRGQSTRTEFRGPFGFTSTGRACYVQVANTRFQATRRLAVNNRISSLPQFMIPRAQWGTASSVII